MVQTPNPKVKNQYDAKHHEEQTKHQIDSAVDLKKATEGSKT
jgi:hypothetical protein